MSEPPRSTIEPATLWQFPVNSLYHSHISSRELAKNFLCYTFAVTFDFNPGRFVGQKRAIARLSGFRRKGHSPTSILFSGPPMTGKTTLALIYARTLLCTGEPADGIFACGECFACRALMSGPYGDFTFVLPRTKQITVQIVEDEYGDFSGALRLPSHSARRIVFIDSAHALNDQTGNMMLKLFEEAPDKTVFILVTDRPYEVLPTIRSRCEEIRFTGESVDFIASELASRGYDEVAARRAASLSQGKWVLAETLMREKPLFDGAEKLMRDFASVLKGGGNKYGLMGSLMAAADELSDAMIRRESEVITWTLPDKEVLDVKDKKSLDRWSVGTTRSNELKRMAQITAFDWLREGLIKRSLEEKKAGGDPCERLDKLPQALDRAGLWLEQNVSEDYILAALLAKL